jgi:hypothetical protein
MPSGAEMSSWLAVSTLQEKSFAAIVVERAARTTVFVIALVMLSSRFDITTSVIGSSVPVTTFSIADSILSSSRCLAA